MKLADSAIYCVVVRAIMLSEEGPKRKLRKLAKRLIISVRGRDSGELVSDGSFVGVWNIDDNGDVPPRWTIGGPKGILQMVRGVAVNSKHKELIVTDKRLNAILTFQFPELFGL